MYRLWKTFIFNLNKVMRKIIRASGTPHQLALGVAIGFFWGVMLVPGQYIFAVVTCTFLRANRVVAFFPVWLSNPATVVPLYTFNYWVGWLLVGGPGVDRIREMLKALLPEMGSSETDFFATPYLWIQEWLRDAWGNIVENIDLVKSLGWDGLLALYAGSVVVGLVLALVSYYVTLYTMKIVTTRIVAKRRMRQERVDTRLREREVETRLREREMESRKESRKI